MNIEDYGKWTIAIYDDRVEYHNELIEVAGCKSFSQHYKGVQIAYVSDDFRIGCPRPPTKMRMRSDVDITKKPLKLSDWLAEQLKFAEEQE